MSYQTPSLIVIADDLTGATDTGVQFAKKAVSALVTMDVDSFDVDGAIQVLVVDTESRHLDPAEAASKVAAVVRRARALGVERLYKKTDSTLRGNIGSELEALLRASGKNIIAFVPAFPRLGRVTRKGMQYVDCQPLHQTVFAADPLNRVASSYIPEIIGEQSTLATKVVPRFNRTGPAFCFTEDGVLIFDAEDDVDLRRIGEFLKTKNLLEISAGSAGFAEFLPKLLDLKPARVAPRRYEGRMLVVSGSVNQISLDQTAAAEKYNFSVVTMPPEMLFTPNGADSSAGERLVAEIIGHEARGADVVLRSTSNRSDFRAYLMTAEETGLGVHQLHRSVAENIGRVVGRVLERSGFKVLTVFGGDTLAGIARMLSWPGLLPRVEVLPGIAASHVAGAASDLIVISKAGGFGAVDVLGQIKDQLRKSL